VLITRPAPCTLCQMLILAQSIQSDWFSFGSVMGASEQPSSEELLRAKSSSNGSLRGRNIFARENEPQPSKLNLQRQDSITEDRKGYYQSLIGTEGYTHVNVTKMITICRHEIAQDVMLEHFVRYMVFILLFCSCVILQKKPVYTHKQAHAHTHTLNLILVNSNVFE